MAMLRNVGFVVAFCCILYLVGLLSVSSAEDKKSAEGERKKPKFNMTRMKEFMLTGEIAWNRTRKDDDMRPSYAILHAHLMCGSNLTNIKDFVKSLMAEEHWPNVHWKNGQDAKPTLYIFTQEKKYAHRIEVADKTSDEIKDLLRSYGFNGSPDPPEEEEVEADKDKKTEL